jgi:hypothetical protein
VRRVFGNGSACKGVLGHALSMVTSNGRRRPCHALACLLIAIAASGSLGHVVPQKCVLVFDICSRRRSTTSLLKVH